MGCELVDELTHTDAVLDRLIVLEGQLRGPLQPQLARKPRLEHAVRSRQAYQSRVPPAVASQTNYFEDELVKILAQGDSSLLRN